MAVTFKDLVNHPYSFAMGVGIANGFLAVGRGKKIDPPTAITLSIILGLGEMALVMREPESERPMSLGAIGAFSILGVLTGVLPFVSKSSAHEPGELPGSPGVPVFASNAPVPGSTPTADAAEAVSGWSRSRRPATTRRRVTIPRRRAA